MSAQEEVRTLNDQIIAAATRGDFTPFATALDDEIEVFDHVPYLFEGKGKFLEYLQGAFTGSESATYTLHQSSCRAISDDVVVMNAYDRLAVTPKGGMPQVQGGRVTWVYAKRGRDWKIVSAHFSPLPKQ